MPHIRYKRLDPVVYLIQPRPTHSISVSYLYICILYLFYIKEEQIIHIEG